ncbi:MAG TPA: preprotein translocase subunit SecA, partial [Corynebacterium variabile]|nr:preprotein translocase subunit SecA [Corynebacterium variabile]
MLGLSKILRLGEGRAVKRLSAVADQVIAKDDEYTALSDAELQAKTEELKERLEAGETLDDILLDAFATAREASWRVLGQKHYKVQIMGGAALHWGYVAEMKTGEG